MKTSRLCINIDVQFVTNLCYVQRIQLCIQSNGHFDKLITDEL